MLGAFVIGFIFGSFLNVCILRIPHGGSIVRPASRCPGCEQPIRWYDNIPVLSWIVLRAQCRNCGVKISLQYPSIELATGLWFATATGISFYGLTSILSLLNPTALIQTLSLCALGFLLIGLAVMDWQTQLLPDEFTLGGTFLGLVFIATETFFIPSVEYKTFFTPEEILIGKHILAALGGYLLLVLIRFLYKRLRKRDGMGLGDAKLLALIGIFLGFGPAIVALFVAVLTASIYGTALLLRGRATATSKLPFGSFLAAAGLLSALVGDRIIDWYATLFR